MSLKYIILTEDAADDLLLTVAACSTALDIKGVDFAGLANLRDALTNGEFHKQLRESLANQSFTFTNQEELEGFFA